MHVLKIICVCVYIYYGHTDFTHVKPVPRQTKAFAPRKRKDNVCGFIQAEADMSDDCGSSDDSEGSNLDHMEASFINDHTQQCTQAADNNGEKRGNREK